MKKLHLLAASLLALAFGRPAGFRTANAKADAPDLQQQLDAQAAEIADLKKQLTLPPDPAPADGTLAMLCKGAGVDLADVRWRIQAGLDPDQAVQAAITQRESDAAARKAKK